VLCSGLLAVVGRLAAIFVGLLAGVASLGSNVLAWSGTPQQLRNERKLFFLGGLVVVALEVVGLAFPAGPSLGPGGVIDILLLLALPFRRLPRMLLDSFDLPPMLSLGSLAVAPLSPVEDGDGCALCEEDLDGTRRRLRFFLGTSGASSATLK
jgi:hypothetical protein